ncbi:MAG: hypothetical protein AAGU19_06505 [Prolixibacteraceae bacterium]
MHLIKLAGVLLLLLLAGLKPAFAQYFVTGEDPANIRWKEINTGNFQLIFPDDYEQKAVRLANILEKVYTQAGRTLNHSPQKISVILHSRSVVSNGLVGWAPKRVELYPTPHQKIYAQDWLEQLAIHEFRHVVQVDKVQSELPRLFRILFGEHAAAAAVGAYLPFWFMEGDAVVTETSLSRTGRGRTPLFLMQSKAQVVEKGIFSYDKASLGSYRDFVPDRYRFGYWFAGAVREQYGARIWSDVLAELAAKPLSVNPMNRVLKRKTGHTKEELYRQVFQRYAGEWQQEVSSLRQSAHITVSPPVQNYTDYKDLYALNDSSFIALRESRGDIDRIVKVTSGRETVIFTPGYVVEESLDVSGELMIWAEQRPNIRWMHASRSVIVLYNTITREKREFHPVNNLFSPVISPDKKSFAAVQSDYAGNYSLVVCDLHTGEQKEIFATSDNHFFLTPVWNASSDFLYFIGLSAEGKYLGSLNIATGEFSILTRPGYYDIRNPTWYDGKIYYTSSQTGIDNIFCLDLRDRQIKQVTTVAFGADYPSVAGDRIFFSNYTSDGYAVSVLNMNDAPGIPGAENEYKYKLAESLAVQEDTLLDLAASEHRDYPVKPYRKGAHLFDFHSWAPVYINAFDYAIFPGVSFLSQNKLGTAKTVLGYEYDPNERSGSYKAEFEYSGLFPVFRSEFLYGNRRSAYYLVSNGGRDTTKHTYTWRELEWNLNVRIPLRFSQGRYSQLIQPEAEYSYRKIMQEKTTDTSVYEGYYHAMSYRLVFQNRIRNAELDILPKWGQTLNLLYRHSLGGGTGISDLKAAESYLYFPGLAKHHGIRIYNGFQIKGTGDRFTFSNVIRFPRGFSSIQNRELFTSGADYMMPLGYPDLSLGRFFYLKRMRGALFGDFSRVESIIYNQKGQQTGIHIQNLNSMGAELTADGHLLRIPASVSAGIRGIYRPDYNNFRIELLLSVNFDSL